jgi:hypothetical protein
MSSEIVIRDDLPVPPVSRHSALVPWADMAVGQCCEIHNEDASLVANSIRNAASNYKKRHGMVFTVRVSDGVIRVWRTA